MPSEKTVAYDDLSYTSAHIFFHDGEPFTGVALDRFETGEIRVRMEFKTGRQHGCQEEFYQSGAKRSVTHYVEGRAHGRTVQWHENGVVSLDRENEFGIMVRCREFDVSGVLFNEYVRPEDDPMMAVIKRRRRDENVA